MFNISKSSWPATLARGWWDDPQCGSFHHLGYNEEMILRRRRVLDDVIGDATVGDHVGPLLHLHGNDGGHGLDAFDVDLRQLLHEGENGVEFAPQMLDLVLGNPNARKLRDAADGIGIDGHGMLQEPQGAYSRAAFAAATEPLLRSPPEASI